ncbi:MAG: hypothetical protein ABI333_10285, partial [bacterium]
AASAMLSVLGSSWCLSHLAGSLWPVIRPVWRATLRGMVRIVVGPSMRWVRCNGNGTWVYEDCVEACQVGLGCVPCVEDAFYCQDDWVMICDGSGALRQDHQCPDSEVCILGSCVSKCDPRVLEPSNVGCEFWAVDLDNEAVAVNDAAAQQFGVAVANVNDYPVVVDVYINTARVGQPVSESEVVQLLHLRQGRQGFERLL